jgi:hypothetical protein
MDGPLEERRLAHQNRGLIDHEGRDKPEVIGGLPFDLDRPARERRQVE